MNSFEAMVGFCCALLIVWFGYNFTSFVMELFERGDE